MLVERICVVVSLGLLIFESGVVFFVFRDR